MNNAGALSDLLDRVWNVLPEPWAGQAHTEVLRAKNAKTEAEQRIHLGNLDEIVLDALKEQRRRITKSVTELLEAA